MQAAFSRRTFAKTITFATAGVATGVSIASQKDAAAPPKPHIKLGFDNFSIRAMNWKAPQLIDYAASLKLDCVFITDLDSFESFDEKHLAELRKNAADKGLQIYAGTWSICPTSKVFKNKWGSADEHLALGIRVAKAVGSPIIRVVLGTRDDRLTEGGIEARIADTAKVCKAARSRALDAGVKIAIENHAGDMQASELVQLIEEAGKDYVGANLDSGNATWTMEDPMQNLETLSPYVLCSSLRNSAIWENDRGAVVQWTAMGDGDIDDSAYLKRFVELCPGAPVNIETISGFNHELPYLKPEFWKAWPKMKAADLAMFVAMAKRGKPRPTHKSANNEEEQQYQTGELERSIKFCKEVLGK